MHLRGDAGHEFAHLAPLKVGPPGVEGLTVAGGVGGASGLGEGVQRVLSSRIAHVIQVNAINGIASGHVSGDGGHVVAHLRAGGARPGIGIPGDGHVAPLVVHPPGVSQTVAPVGAERKAVQRLWRPHPLSGRHERAHVLGGGRLPGGVDVQPGMHLQPGSVSARDHLGQRVPAGIDAQRRAQGASEARRPGLQPRGVEGVARGAHLKKDGVEPRRRGLVDNALHIAWRWRDAVGGPVVTAYPEGAQLGDGLRGG